MSAMYGNTTVIKQGKSYYLQPELESVMAASRDYEELLWAWKSWHDSFDDMKPLYTQLIDLQNKVAKECGKLNLYLLSCQAKTLHLHLSKLFSC